MTDKCHPVALRLLSLAYIVEAAEQRHTDAGAAGLWDSRNRPALYREMHRYASDTPATNTLTTLQSTAVVLPWPYCSLDTSRSSWKPTP